MFKLLKDWFKKFTIKWYSEEIIRTICKLKIHTDKIQSAVELCHRSKMADKTTNNNLCLQIRTDRSSRTSLSNKTGVIITFSMMGSNRQTNWASAPSVWKPAKLIRGQQNLRKNHLVVLTECQTFLFRLS